MDLDLRTDLKTIIDSRADKFHLHDENDLSFGTFIAQYGYHFKFSALDNYLATLAILESPDNTTAKARFINALDSLSK
jgi:hypothetical protein